MARSMAEAATDERGRLVEDALGQGWYHTIDLGDGAVTPGGVDLRAAAPKVLPADLSGKRALDVGTFDGFWAFELERRGAEVVATDLERFDQAEWPPPSYERLAADAGDTGPGERFHLAHAILGSNVRRVISPIYEISPERVGGHVDFALIGAILIHLRDPVGGLQAVRSALAPGGRFLSVEPYDVPLTEAYPDTPVARLESNASDYNWWRPNLACLHDWLRTAGYEHIEQRGDVFELKATETCSNRTSRWKPGGSL